MDAPNLSTRSFGSFRLDASRRVLQSADGTIIDLPPRAFDTLAYLIEHPGRLVRKSELLKAVWPNVVVEENNLNQAISAIRRALGEQADRPRYIATLPGRGYQFIEAVELSPETVAEERASSPTAPAPASAPSSRSRRKIVTGVLATIALAVAITFGLMHRSSASPHTLAVLPFKPLVPNVSDPVLEFGMADTLITQLSQRRGLVVSPLSSVSRYGTLDQDPIAVARLLGVQSVLEGHLYRQGDRLRVSVRLLDASSGKPRWARQFDEHFVDVFAIQDAIASEVATHLPGDIAETPPQPRRTTRDPEAYQLYVTGRFLWADRSGPNLKLAIDNFEKAIARDQQYTLAYSALADAYAVSAVLGVLPPQPAFNQARAAAKRALELDPNLAEAHASMGHILVQYDHNWGAGEGEYRRAIELNPKYAMSYHWLGMLYNYRGRFDEALSYMRAAQELEPEQKAFSANIGNVLYHAHRYDEAIRQLQHTVAMDENFELALAFLGRAYLRKGDASHALEFFKRRRSPLYGRDGDMVQAYVAAGQETRARELLAEMLKRASTEYVSAYDIASAYAGLGEKDASLQWLARAFEEHSQHVGHLPHDPAFEAVHGDSRYEQLVLRLGL
jgi:DNA-binding winged helix-turn-helix (wHTH) protein/TolB-like protein/tetratricopeptide (TPR) repeat protein